MTNPDETSAPPGGYVSIPDGVLLQHVADETVLLHLESGVYYGLEAVGTRMLDLACELEDPEDIVRQLLEEYDAPAEVLHRDLDHLLCELEEKGLARREDRAARRATATDGAEDAESDA